MSCAVTPAVVAAIMLKYSACRLSRTSISSSFMHECSATMSTDHTVATQLVQSIADKCTTVQPLL